MAAVPKRTADTMAEAIGLSSPNGRMSKRARSAANERLRRSLFGEGGLQRPSAPQPAESARLLQQARELRELAARGMNTRAYNKKADELEARARGEKPAAPVRKRSPRAVKKISGGAATDTGRWVTINGAHVLLKD